MSGVAAPQDCLSFFDKLSERSAVPVWDNDGNMTFWKAPKDYNWESLQDGLLRTGKPPKLTEGRQAEDWVSTLPLPHFVRLGNVSALRRVNLIASGRDIVI